MVPCKSLSSAVSCFWVKPKSTDNNPLVGFGYTSKSFDKLFSCKSTVVILRFMVITLSQPKALGITAVLTPELGSYFAEYLIIISLYNFCHVLKNFLFNNYPSINI